MVMDDQCYVMLSELVNHLFLYCSMTCITWSISHTFYTFHFYYTLTLFCGVLALHVFQTQQPHVCPFEPLEL